MNHNHHDLPMLAGIAAILHWLESLASIISGPLLTLGLGIALVSLLTNGQLLVNVPALLFVWAVSMAIGTDALLVGSSFQVAHSLRSRHYFAALGYALLVAALAYVAYIAALVFATQEAQGITTAEALGQLGFDSTSWILQRSLLSVALVVLSGLLRYVAPTKQEASLEDERAKLERELELEPLRQRARALKAVGAVGLGRQAIAAARGKPQEPTPPNNGGTPVSAQVVPNSVQPPDQPIEPRQLRAVSQPREMAATNTRSNGRKRRKLRSRNTRTVSVEPRIRAAYQPGMSVRDLATAAGVSSSAASKWRKVILAESAQQVAQ
jgi:hypothetical protein